MSDDDPTWGKRSGLFAGMDMQQEEHVARVAALNAVIRDLEARNAELERENKRLHDLHYERTKLTDSVHARAAAAEARVAELTLERDKALGKFVEFTLSRDKELDAAEARVKAYRLVVDLLAEGVCECDDSPYNCCYMTCDARDEALKVLAEEKALRDAPSGGV